MRANKLLAGILATVLVASSMSGSVFAADKSVNTAPVGNEGTITVESEVFYDRVGDLYDIGPDISFFGMGSNTSFNGKYYNQLDDTSKKIYDFLYAAYQKGSNVGDGGGVRALRTIE